MPREKIFEGAELTTGRFMFQIQDAIDLNDNDIEEASEESDNEQIRQEEDIRSAAIIPEKEDPSKNIEQNANSSDSDDLDDLLKQFESPEEIKATPKSKLIKSQVPTGRSGT